MQLSDILTIAEEKHLFGECYREDYIKVMYGTNSVFYIYSDNSFTQVDLNGYVTTGNLIN